MRTLFVSNFYPPYDLGGWEQNCQEVVQSFLARGHVCQVLTSNFGTNRGLLPEEGINRSLFLQADIHYYRPLDFFLRRPFQERHNRTALDQMIEVFKPDTIFIWGLWNLSQQIAYWAEQWLPGRVAYAVAGYWFMQPNPHEAYWQHPARRSSVRALMAPAQWLALANLARDRKTYPLKLEQVACVSEFVRKKLIAADILPQGARIIYNGIDPAPFLEASARRQTDPSVLRLVYTGSLVPHKGVHTAIEALGLLKAQDALEGIHLSVVGGGHPDYERQLRERVRDLGLSEYVSFQGRVPRSAVPGILASHDVFLFTSVYEEPIARSVMEAMGAGLAVIGTSVGGQVEMLSDNVNALVYPPDDAGKLAACILALKHEPIRRARLAQSGQEMVLARFTLDRMVDEMETWLEELITA